MRDSVVMNGDSLTCFPAALFERAVANAERTVSHALALAPRTYAQVMDIAKNCAVVSCGASGARSLLQCVTPEGLCLLECALRSQARFAIRAVAFVYFDYLEIINKQSLTCFFEIGNPQSSFTGKN